MPQCASSKSSWSKPPSTAAQSVIKNSKPPSKNTKPPSKNPKPPSSRSSVKPKTTTERTKPEVKQSTSDTLEEDKYDEAANNDEEEALEEVKVDQEEREDSFGDDNEDANINSDDSEDGDEKGYSETKKGGKQCKMKLKGRIEKKLSCRPGYTQKQTFILDTCHTISKLVPCAVALFTPVDDIMWAGTTHSNKALELGIEIADHPHSTPNEKSFAILEKFLEHDVTIFKALHCFPKHQIGMQAMIKDLCIGFKESWGSDTNKVRNDILTLLVEDPVNKTIMLPKPTHKMVQGFNHIDTGCLLCPQIYLKRFDENDRFIFDLANGKVKVMASEWPSFLYDQTLYDPLDNEAGFMKGYLLLRVFLHIFCSNGDPMKQEGPKRGSIAKINGICLVTGCMIAYAACQGCYALSSKDGWTEQDGAFDMTAFYDSIVALFESHPDDEWMVETLAWWNEQIFGDENGRTDVDKTQDAHPPDSTVAKMAARHEAWAKAQAEAAAAATSEDLMATD
ncbi:uncharacterized protein EV420DRAFT_1651270 [Desarmillaria tabescens]|uniref:Uncharacterized protein n=1 Tax=Armillaria tabescens TaxID=1929756 RepID=A0AA39JBC0_ARMTA|nr:uncharacterized protein EV420DRAFT_1651270 [Desarmillaria tabescens]KAK0438852.1 hypothetical protein EV420DRAFT_1651270 [Desarmillaria tabescens]